MDHSGSILTEVIDSPGMGATSVLVPCKSSARSNGTDRSSLDVDGTSNTLFLHVRANVYSFSLDEHGARTASRNAVHRARNTRDVRPTRAIGTGHERCVIVIDYGITYNT